MNIRNENGNGYFRWCHLAHLFPASTNPQRITKYKDKINEVDYTEIEFPVKLKDIPKIEKNNDIRFDIFGFKSGYKCCIYPLYISDKVCERTCEMLFITNETSEKLLENLGENINSTEKCHYVYIKDFNSLMFNQTKYKTRKLFLQILPATF